MKYGLILFMSLLECCINVDVLEAFSSRAVGSRLRSEMQLMEVAPVSADGSPMDQMSGITQVD